MSYRKLKFQMLHSLIDAKVEKSSFKPKDWIQNITCGDIPNCWDQPVELSGGSSCPVSRVVSGRVRRAQDKSRGYHVKPDMVMIGEKMCCVMDPMTVADNGDLENAHNTKVTKYSLPEEEQFDLNLHQTLLPSAEKAEVKWFGAVLAVPTWTMEASGTIVPE